MTQDEFMGEKPPCDLVLKGGNVSDVVYPSAIVELAKHYRLSSVGGASAGALAASIAAAAEYARDKGGFLRVAAIPGEVADHLFDLFQPAPELKPLFDMVAATFGKKSSLAKVFGIIAAAVRGYAGTTFSGALPGLLIVFFAFAARDEGWLAFGVLSALLGATLFLALRLACAITKKLPAANFGLCSGQTLPGASYPALTDWLADIIDRVAGNLDAEGRLGRPLTFGDLKTRPNGPPIELAMMTSDLSMLRPYQLPFRDRECRAHFFSRADFAKLFPTRVMEVLCRNKQPLPVRPEWRDCPADLFSFPQADELPIIVAARLSLSLPGVFQAVPLYKRDPTLRHAREQPRKCLFSDGGLTSNFPIHFFDRLWPNSPTFAIAFDEYSEERHHDGTKEIRVDMARDLSEGEYLPILPISGFVGFVSRLLDCAMNWQDNLQSVLPGYRERIVHVHLKAEEGGFNLKMPRTTIERLVRFGEIAGTLPAGADFNMDEHRWRRFLVSMAELEETVGEILDSYKKKGVIGGNFSDFLKRYGGSTDYPPKNPDWQKELLLRAGELVDLGERWTRNPKINSGNIPKPECDLRLTAKQ